MAIKMGHTCVRVKDLDASIDFYTKAFGFEVSRHRDFPENKFTLVYLTLPGDGYELELTYNYDHGPYELGTGFGHIAVATDDLEGLHAKLSEEGFDVTPLKNLPGIPPSYFFVMDPDGYKVEVVRIKD